LERQPRYASPGQDAVNTLIGLYKQGRLQEALEQGIALAERYPNVPLIPNLLGAVYMGMRRTEEAVASFRKALEIKPDSAATLMNLGIALNALGSYQEAAASFRKTLEINPEFPEARGHFGNVLSNLGQYEEAVANYQRVVALKPDDADTQNNLGVALNSLGKHEEAVASFRRALALEPDHAHIYNNLGVALNSLGKHEEAVDGFRKAAVLKPDYAEAHNNLGIALNSLGSYEEAAAGFRKALEINPEYPGAHGHLGIVLTSLGKHDEAVANYQRAVVLKPDDADAQNNLGVALNSLGKHEEAVTSLQRALSLKPDYAHIYYNLGIALKNLGKHEEAVASFRKAVDIKPDYAEASNDLGVALVGLGRHEEAVASFRKALDIKPDYAEASNDLGVALVGLGRHEEAVASFRKALEIKPDYAEAYNNLGLALKNLGKEEEAVDSFYKAVDLDKDYVAARGNLLHQLALICDWEHIEDTLRDYLNLLKLGLNSGEVVSPFNLLNLTDDAGFHRRISEAFSISQYKQDFALGPLLKRQNADRIRIGYFSADFHNHATMFLTAEMFERHDRSKFEIHVFSFGPDRHDKMRRRLLSSVEAFHDVRFKGNAEIAELSRSLGIDIAVDLKGYTKDSRARIFSYRAAPIQVNYLGYPGTMGAPYIDYIIADATLIPPAYREFYSEKVAYLPGSYQVNDGSREISGAVMTRSDFGLPEEGFVFCCFNNNYKITPDVFDIWMRLLDQVEGSVLWLLKANESAERNLRKEAGKREIDPSRLIFADRVPLADHLARHRLADLFLDTFNYNAHTTASDALWAGLPVLTNMGESFPSRVAGSLLNAVELPELITTTAREYEDAALMLATHPNDLRALKKKLRQNLKTTALFDAAIFTRNMESAFTQMFERQKAGLDPDHLYVEN